MRPSGINIEKCTVVSFVILILEGWCKVDHHSTEYFIITMFIKPKTEISVQALIDLSGLLTNLYEKMNAM